MTYNFDLLGIWDLEDVHIVLWDCGSFCMQLECLRHSWWNYLTDVLSW